MNVVWSIHKATTSSIIEEVIQLANAIISERARIPRAPNRNIDTEEVVELDVARIDEEIRNAEHTLGMLRARRISLRSNREENIKAVAEYDSVVATVEGRIDELIGDFKNRNDL